MPTLISLLKTASREIASATTPWFRCPEDESQYQCHPPSPRHSKGLQSKPRASWKNPAKPAMTTLLRSMTPPIDVNDPYAPEYIQSLIYSHNRPTLTEEDVYIGPTVELYVLSYRHESKVTTERISLQRLRIATEIIRSHAAELGRQFYSIWIDSLFIPTFVDPTATRTDRGLPPYALCHVVAVPSDQGFNKDLARAWIRCEHQLAANGRGLLLHPSHQPPTWTQGYRMSVGRSHRKIYGANQMPNCALYALASGICLGMLEGAKASFQEDLDDLQRWAFSLVCERWSARDLHCLPGRTAYMKEPGRDNKIRNMLSNTSDFFIAWEKDWRLVTHTLPMIRPRGNRRKWDGARELLHSLTRHIRLPDVVGTDEALFVEIREKSRGFLVTCTNGRERGMYICYWKHNGVPIVMELEIAGEEDGTKSIAGYRVIHQQAVRKAFASFREASESKEASYIGKVICSLDCCVFMRLLTDCLFEGGYIAADQMAVADCSRWFVGLK